MKNKRSLAKPCCCLSLRTQKFLEIAPKQFKKQYGWNERVHIIPCLRCSVARFCFTCIQEDLRYIQTFLQLKGQVIASKPLSSSLPSVESSWCLFLIISNSSKVCFGSKYRIFCCLVLLAQTRHMQLCLFWLLRSKNYILLSQWNRQIAKQWHVCTQNTLGVEKKQFLSIYFLRASCLTHGRTFISRFWTSITWTYLKFLFLFPNILTPIVFLPHNTGHVLCLFGAFSSRTQKSTIG